MLHLNGDGRGVWRLLDQAERDALGLPAQAFTYLTSHGSLDQAHMQFFETLMNRVDDAADRCAIIHAARVFYKLYGDIFRGLPAAEHARQAV